ncbi:MAG: ABC transporter substrate-binding protein, partial [Clostridiales bacterium]
MKRFKKRLALTLAMLMVVPMLVSCKKGESSSVAGSSSVEVKDTEAGKVALFVPQTGDLKQYGDALVRGVELGFEVFNRENNTNFELDIYDDKGDPNESVNLANLIVSKGTYFAAMGSYTSGCAMAATPIFEEANMVLFSPTGSHKDFPLMSPITFG